MENEILKKATVDSIVNATVISKHGVAEVLNETNIYSGLFLN
jgi:hypothetical protein